MSDYHRIPRRHGCITTLMIIGGVVAALLLLAFGVCFFGGMRFNPQ